MPRNMYQQALDSQTACNLSELIYSLPKIADEVWEEIRAGKSSTTKFSEHPVIRLISEQIAFLGMQSDYSKAAQECEEKAKAPEPEGDTGLFCGVIPNAPEPSASVHTPDKWKVEGIYEVQR